MTLLTPPRSSSKENNARFAFAAPLKVDIPKMQASKSTLSAATATPSSASRNVVWSPHNSYHSLATPAKTPPTAASTNAWVMDRPVRSILKRRPHPLADTTNSNRAPTSKSTPADVSGLSDLPEDLDSFFRTREATPEPSEPLTNLDYLNYPVSLILKENAKPREIIEGYSILAARLRTNVQYSTEADASWPLFQPLRKQRTRFVECVVRDLGRARVDPITTLDCPASEEEEEAMKEWVEDDEGPSTGLPSPQLSPRKPKKKGMTAAQVKYARDLCTISHAALKLLCLVFSVPATFSVFEDKELKSMLNAALAIPLAEHLPTPNARKTCALAILLLQCQRLPESVVLPARDRIALCLKRGINGELGKEGKKGSANDGLKAIHDLSLLQPTVFVPAFTSGIFLRCILQNLLAPTLALRVQACHALGGVAYALASLPPSSMHAVASDVVLDFVMTPTPATPTKASKATPSLPPKDSSIIRTLRTTINATDATHIAQSPVWSISVLASLIVLAGSRMYTSKKVCLTLLNVLKLASKSKKPSIRYLFASAWRTLTWVWFQPDYDTLKDDGEDEKTDSDSAEDSKARSSQRDDNKDRMREVFFTLLSEWPDLQSGLATVIALLNCPLPSTAKTVPNEALNRALEVLQAMANSVVADTVHDAAHVLLNLFTPSDNDSRRPSSSGLECSHSVLPSGLFCSEPTTGLLAADPAAGGNGAGSVLYAVKQLFDQVPNLDFVPVLSEEQLRNPWVWSKLSRVWRRILGGVRIGDQFELPEELTRIWDNLVLAQIGSGGEEKDDVRREERLEAVMDVIISVLEDKDLDFRANDEESAMLAASSSKVGFPSVDESTSSEALSKQTKNELKMKVARALFATVKTVASKEQLEGRPLFTLFFYLMSPKHVAEWTQPRASAPPLTRKRQRTTTGSLSPWTGGSTAAPPSKEMLGPISTWTSLVVSVMSVAEGEAAREMMKMFWGLARVGDGEESLITAWDAEVKAAVWKTAVNAWRKNEASWDGSVVLLAAPFATSAPSAKAMWTFSKEERDKWEQLHEYAVSKAADFGFDCAAVVDGIAEIMLAAKDSLLSIGEGTASPMSTPRSCVSIASSSNPGCSDIVLGSLIQISDLLLERLDISEARDLPTSLISLVSETMKVAYPVAASNVTHATWLAASVAQAVEKCPKSLVKSFIEGVSDSLAVWLADESESWSESALDNTFVSLYENLLLCITELPEDLDFLEKISSFLESVFSGSRPLSPSVMASFRAAFELFWESGPYSKMEEPTCGWPLNVNRCLGLEEILPRASTFDSETEEVFAVPATPKQGATRKLDAGAPRTPMAHMNGLTHIPSPHRPHKSSIDGGAPFPLSTSPVSPVRRRRRTSSSSSYGSGFGLSFFGTGALSLAPGPEIADGPSKRRRLSWGDAEAVSDAENRDNKENSSPVRGRPAGFASPLRAGGRIPAPLFETSSTSGGDESTKKRKKMRDRMGARKPQVKRDISPAESVASTSSVRGSTPDEEEAVARSLVPFPSVGDSPAPQMVELGTIKKRKRNIIDAAAIVNAELSANRRRKLEHVSSFESILRPGPSSSTTTTPTRSQDEPKTPALKKRRKSLSLESLGRAPFAVADPEDDPFQVEVSTTTPLPALKFSNSRPHVRVEEVEEVVDDEQAQIPSSDDDPRYGQVTPHHIISPPLAQKAGKVYVSKAKQNASPEGVEGERRVSFQEVEESDDDSFAEPASSPSKKVVERRMMQRQNSLTKEGERLKTRV